MNGHSLLNNCSFKELEKFLLKITNNIIECPNHTSKFVGFNNYDINNSEIEALNDLPHDNYYLPQHIILPDCSFKVINGLLSAHEVKFFNTLYLQLTKETMSSYAVRSSFSPEPNGIQRASIYNYNLAFYLFAKTFPHIDIIKVIDGNLYLACQLNPLLRFIEYRHNNCLIPHHDTAIRLNENIVSASSIILYLSNNVLGKTRIIKENIDNPRDIKDTDILYEVAPNEGQCMIFDHNILHDSSSFHKTHPHEKNKLIITTEVIYYKLSEQQLNYLKLL